MDKSYKVIKVELDLTDMVKPLELSDCEKQSVVQEHLKFLKGIEKAMEELRGKYGKSVSPNSR